MNNFSMEQVINSLTKITSDLPSYVTPQNLVVLAVVVIASFLGWRLAMNAVRILLFMVALVVIGMVVGAGVYLLIAQGVLQLPV